MTRVATVLSGSTTEECKAQLMEAHERGRVHEGQLVIVRREHDQSAVLARIASILPYNDFFTEGDPWSEARRRNVAIPSNVARQYEIAELELLREIGGFEVTYPPRPGDRVELIDPDRDYAAIFDTTTNEGLVQLGSLAGYQNLPIPLRVDNIPMHFAIFGVTGSGKSFTTGALIEKLLHIPAQNNIVVSYPMIVVDANGDYLNYARPQAAQPAEWSCGWVRRFVFPKKFISMHTEPGEAVEQIGISLDELGYRDVAELILLYYRGSATDLSAIQIAQLEQLLVTFNDDKGISPNQVFSNDAHFQEFIATLQGLGGDVMNASAKQAAVRALRTFRNRMEDEQLLSAHSAMREPDFTHRLTTDRAVVILDFSGDGAPGVDLPTKQLVIACLASMLYKQFTEYKIHGDQRYLLFLIEEAQNFCPGPQYPVGSHLARVKLMSIATQGRKFGLSLCLVSQRPSFLDPVVLSMCNSFIVHRLALEDVDFVGRASGGLPPSMRSRLTSLRRGEFILAGQMATVPFALKGFVRETDRHVEHVAGTTNVVDDLAHQATGE